MNTVKRMTAVALAVLLSVSLAACGGNKTPDGSEMDYLPSIPPLLDVAITDCLPESDVGNIMGVPMSASDPYEDGTWVMYTSDDLVRTVSVSMENATEQIYDEMIKGLSGGKQIKELSARAYWYEDRGEMIDYCNGYSIAVTVTDPYVANTYGLCQAMVKKIRENLSGEQ